MKARSEKLRFGKKTICPCPAGKKKYCPIVDGQGHPTGGGKCWAPSCRQRFFPPPTTRRSPTTVQEPARHTVRPVYRAEQHVHDVEQPVHRAEQPVHHAEQRVQRGEQPVHHAEQDERKHVYTDADGQNIMQVTVKRTADGTKKVWVAHWNGSAWVKGADDVQRIPYRLPALLEHIGKDGIVVIVEGEKDVETAAVHGIVATCNPFGAGKWTDDLSTWLEGARVVIIPDNDEAGTQHAATVTESLLRTGAASVRTLDLCTLMPDLPTKGDLSDYLELGGSADALRNAIERCVSQTEDAREDVHGSLPEIKWDLLPNNLRELINAVVDERERTALLAASITTIGAALPNVKTQYHGKWYSPGLYFMVVGPAGSGKSAICPAETIVRGIKEAVNEEAKAEERAHRQRYAQWKASGEKAGDPPPQPPEVKCFQIPADSTGTVIIRSICSNPGVLIFDTEADTLEIAFRKDMLDVSSALRKAWQGESVSQARIKDNRHIETGNPHVSLVLSGTPEQCKPLVRHRESGLTSRFRFMLFPPRRIFSDPYAATNSAVHDAAEGLGGEVLKLWQHARSIGASGSIQVTLQPRQQQNLYDYYRSVFENPDDDSDSATTLRSGIVAVRIMVVLTVLRHWSDKGAIERLMQVHDDDYHNAMALSERLRGDTEFVMNEILHGGEHGERSRYEERHDLWYEKLPISFTTKQAVAVGEHVGIKKSTIHKLLRDRPDIEKLSHGNYRRKAPPSGRSP